MELTLEQLKDKMLQSDNGLHIWVKVKKTFSFGSHTETYYDTWAAITDYVADLGVVAIWSAGGPDNYLTEKDYGTLWWAYTDRPELPEEDDHEQIFCW